MKFKSFFKLRLISLFSALFGTFLFLSCVTDEIQIDRTKLEGKLEGNDWSYSSANAFLISTSGQYIIRFISDKESVTNPCTLRSPGLSHVKAIFRPTIGNYAVDPFALADNQVQVVFQLSNSESLIANSGFMEVYDINASIITGYLQAIEDSENTFVQGNFQIKICN